MGLISSAKSKSFSTSNVSNSVSQIFNPVFNSPSASLSTRADTRSEQTNTDSDRVIDNPGGEPTAANIPFRLPSVLTSLPDLSAFASDLQAQPVQNFENLGEPSPSIISSISTPKGKLILFALGGLALFFFLR